MLAHQMQSLLGCCSCRSAVRHLRYKVDGQTLDMEQTDTFQHSRMVHIASWFT